MLRIMRPGNSKPNSMAIRNRTAWNPEMHRYPVYEKAVFSMRHLSALLGKEWMETLRDTKRLVLFAVFVFFGLLSPLTAKLTPELFSLVSSSPGMSGIKMSFPAPDIFTYYEQFMKNMSQMIMFALVLVFMGSVSQEKADGTAALVMTKGVSRSVFLTAKLLSEALIITVSYWLSASLFLIYTALLYGTAIIPGTWGALSLMWLYLLFVAAIVLMASTFSKSLGISALLSFGMIFFLMAISAFPVLRDWSPISLSSLPIRVLQGLTTFRQIIRPVIAAVLAIPLCWLIASRSFSRQEL
jgi:ABC-2 type transport system permease protein